MKISTPLAYIASFFTLFFLSHAVSLNKLFDAGTSHEKPYPLLDSKPFTRPVFFSQAAFCDPKVDDKILDATVHFRAGDGREIPTIYVAHSPIEGIIVSCQGTNKSDKASVLNDLELNLKNADKRFSQCLDEDSDIHAGFQETWSHTAEDVLVEVQSLLKLFPDSPVLVTGHSLGAAVSTIFFVWLRCRLPLVIVSAIVFGSPRVGDVNFANSIDRLASNGNTFTRIVNGKDSVPHLPPRALNRHLPGYWHPRGEIWIEKANEPQALVCPGQENSFCSDQYHIYETKWRDHSGMYFGTVMKGVPGFDRCTIVHGKIEKPKLKTLPSNDPTVRP